MKEKNMERKIISIEIISIIILSGFFIFEPIIPTNHIAEATSFWTLNSDIDLNSGTLDNSKIVGTDSEAELILKNSPEEWTVKTPMSKPSKRCGHSMAPVYGSDKVVLFGGNYNTNYFNDTWVYDFNNNNWTKKFPQFKPSARNSHSMASIYGTDKVLLFGGTNGGYYDDTWIYDLSMNNWSKVQMSTKPKARRNHEMATIWGTDKVVLFGGENASVFDDTWIFNISDYTWTEKNLLKKPNPRIKHAMASIHGTKKVVLFGGYGGSNNFGDTWVYNQKNNTWTKKSMTNSPLDRDGHSISSIFGDDKVVLFGGYRSGNELNDTWTYDLSDNNWTQKMPLNKPGARKWHAMAFVYGIDKVILFGGYKGGYINETWVYGIYTFMTKGTYKSMPYDTGSNTSFKTINWNSAVQINTSIKFQIRTASTFLKLNLENFLGPDGTTNTYYFSTPSNIWSGHMGDRWIQFMVYLSTTNVNETPRLKQINITYNRMPITLLYNPVNGKAIPNNKPIFEWNFTDLDSSQQTAFQVLIDDVSTFVDIDFDSNIQNSINQQWQFPLGTSYTSIPDGTWYWKVRTMDNDGDWGQFSLPWKIIIDTKSPYSELTIPINNGYYNKLTAISGTASDPIYGSGLSRVEISIKRIIDDKHWNGIDWVSSEEWISVSGTSSWSYDSHSIKWTSNTNYIVRSRVTDNATNVEIPGYGNYFTIDMEKPLSLIEHPMNDTYLNKLENIYGKAMDKGGSGLGKIEISIGCFNNNKYWSDIGWDTNETWLEATGKDTFSYNVTDILWSTGNQYIIYSRAIDNVDNIEIPSYGITFIFDDSPPEQLSIYINNDDEYTNTSAVDLSLSVKEVDFGVSQMAFSNDNKIWTAWEEFHTIKSYNLTPSDGDKKVYFKVQDRAGNIADAVYDSIILDTIPPKNLSILINHGVNETNSTSVMLELNAVDNTSGIFEMSFSKDCMNWSEWENFMNTKNYTLTSEDGIKNIYFRVKDKAGNIASPAVSTIILNTTQPIIKPDDDTPIDDNKNRSTALPDYGSVNIIIILGLVLIAFIVIIVVLFLIRKKKIVFKRFLIAKPGTISVPEITMKQISGPQQFESTRPPSTPRSYKGPEIRKPIESKESISLSSPPVEKSKAQLPPTNKSKTIMNDDNKENK
jgi:hypothetical protein